jgi:hypothetical protein
MPKYYLANASAPVSITDTGYHSSAINWLEITPGKAIVALPNAQTAPGDYLYIAQGANLAIQSLSAADKTQITTFFGLSEPVTADRMGRALFQAKTWASPNDESTLEPNIKGYTNLWFGGELLHQRRFRPRARFAQKIMDKKHNGYKNIRAVNIRKARKWLRHQERLGFRRKDIQREHFNDGASINPQTTWIETGAQELTWTAIGGTLVFTGTQFYNTTNSHVGGAAAESLSSGDMRGSLDVDYATNITTMGPVIRHPDGTGLSADWCMTLYHYTDTWYLRRMWGGVFGTFATTTTFARTADYTIEPIILTAEGSDFTCNAAGDIAGPFTDTNVSSSNLYGGFYSSNSVNRAGELILTDELGGADSVRIALGGTNYGDFSVAENDIDYFGENFGQSF